ncbi:MAG: hypothetical protein L0L09_13385 [Staphylococcus equorum]|nr:hypothetical protein [Staphylococcus equorum]
MAYKYQAKNGSCIEVVNMMAGSKELSKPMVDELDEVYRKARLLDDVVATTKRRLSVQERKAKAFDELKKHVDEEGDSYMVLYRQTKDPAYSLLNSHYDNLLGFMEELEDK